MLSWIDAHPNGRYLLLGLLSFVFVLFISLAFIGEQEILNSYSLPLQSEPKSFGTHRLDILIVLDVVNFDPLSGKIVLKPWVQVRYNGSLSDNYIILWARTTIGGFLYLHDYGQGNYQTNQGEVSSFEDLVVRYPERYPFDRYVGECDFDFDGIEFAAVNSTDFVPVVQVRPPSGWNCLALYYKWQNNLGNPRPRLSVQFAFTRDYVNSIATIAPLLFFSMLVGISLFLPVTGGKDNLALRISILVAVGVFSWSYGQAFLGIEPGALGILYLSAILLSTIMSSIIVIVVSVVAREGTFFPSEIRTIEFLALLFCSLTYVTVMAGFGLAHFVSQWIYGPYSLSGANLAELIWSYLLIWGGYQDFRILSWMLLIQVPLWAPFLWRQGESRAVSMLLVFAGLFVFLFNVWHSLYGGDLVAAGVGLIYLVLAVCGWILPIARRLLSVIIRVGFHRSLPSNAPASA